MPSSLDLDSFYDFTSKLLTNSGYGYHFLDSDGEIEFSKNGKKGLISCLNPSSSSQGISRQKELISRARREDYACVVPILHAGSHRVYRRLGELSDFVDKYRQFVDIPFNCSFTLDDVFYFGDLELSVNSSVNSLRSNSVLHGKMIYFVDGEDDRYLRIVSPKYLYLNRRQGSDQELGWKRNLQRRIRVLRQEGQRIDLNSPVHFPFDRTSRHGIVQKKPEATRVQLELFRAS